MSAQYLETRTALGTDVELRLVTADKEEAEKHFVRMWQEVEAFEAKVSRFRPDSELSKLNAHAGGRVELSPEFCDVLREAVHFRESTQGIFNPFILPALLNVGYTKSLLATDTTTLAHDLPDATMRASHELEVGDTWARIPPRSAIDLGGIGKGYLADRLAKLVVDEVEGYCLSLGGDMALGGNDDTGNVWVVETESADSAHDVDGVCTCMPGIGGVATSGDVRVRGLVRQSHQIDPRTGELAGVKGVCSVAAPSATAADVFASCVLLGGSTYAEPFIERGVILGVYLRYEGQASVVLGKGFSKHT